MSAHKRFSFENTPLNCSEKPLFSKTHFFFEFFSRTFLLKQNSSGVPKKKVENEGTQGREGRGFVVGVGRRLRGARGLGGGSGGNGGSRSDNGGLRLCRGSVEGTSNTWEAQLGRRDWWATLGGQARDQSRLREGNRATQTRSNTGAAAWRPWSAFRQRRRWARASARPGRGSPEWRGAQQRGRHLTTGRGRWSRHCGSCRSCRNQKRAWGWRSSTATWTGRPHDSGEAHSDGVLERGQHWELGRELTKLITARHGAGKSTNQRGQRAKSALWARNEDWKCSGTMRRWDSAPGAPRWQASMSSLSKSAEQACDRETENQGAETAEPEDTEQGRGAAEESQARQQAPSRG